MEDWVEVLFEQVNGQYLQLKTYAKFINEGMLFDLAMDYKILQY